MSKKENLALLLTAVREIASMVIGACEDYLGTTYDRSLLAKRREKLH